MGNGQSCIVSMQVANNTDKPLWLHGGRGGEEDWGVFVEGHSPPTMIAPGDGATVVKRGRENSPSGSHFHIEYRVGDSGTLLELVGSSPHTARQSPQLSAVLLHHRTFPRLARAAFVYPTDAYHVECQASITAESTEVSATVSVNSGPAPLGPQQTLPFEVRVVVYNVWCIPIVSREIDARQRTIAEQLAKLQPPPDVIVFCEAFSGWDTLAELCADAGFAFHAPVLNRTDSQGAICNGGVLIVSRWPVRLTEKHYESDYVFQAYEAKSNDRHSGKGVKYVRLEMEIEGRPQPVHVLGTHTQATETDLPYDNYQAKRKEQARELAGWLQQLNIPRDEPVIVAGDFNVDAIARPQDACDVLRLMGAISEPLPVPAGESWRSYGGACNKLCSDQAEWLDYAAAIKTHLRPTSVLVAQLCAADDEASPLNGCSDHYPVHVTFRYGETSPSTD
eukprot:TRINITY_DN60696_c0_g1_i1.p1 TRINITY_DN60696_c0_g1~~TRINITY_DN60696_c0_g1_i1.p1  ORF type:complete len:457 (+),score=62.51 TRINITY_DN60696_c0_g1_i1:26-1372(+)